MFARKIALAFASGALAWFVVAALPVLDAIDAGEFDTARTLGFGVAVGCVTGGARAVIALLTAFVPTDAEHGVNLVGKFK